MPHAPSSPALRYLEGIAKKLNGIRRDLPDLIAMGERMAEPLLKGGDIFVPPVAPFWTSEFCGRSGGLMGIPKERYHGESKNDVYFFALPDPRRWQAEQKETARRLLRQKGHLFAIGRPQDAAPLPDLSKRIAGFTGAAAAEEGEYRYGDFAPLVGFREFELFVRGWIAAGEMVAACTRAGRMPILWMSVWLEGAMVRNAYFTRHDNLREPWRVPLFHDNHYVPPLAAGYVGNSFLDFIEGVRKRLAEQAVSLRLAGHWLAEAARRGKRIWAVLVGHAYPEILGCGKRHHKEHGDCASRAYPLSWGWSISDLRRALPKDFGPGDVGLHLGYGPTRPEDVRHWLKRGIRLIHTSPYGRPRGLRDHPRFIWFDLPWRPADATVDVPGYSVRLLPGSSSCQTMAYFAILSEAAEAARWK